jgi:hypothetical protein
MMKIDTTTGMSSSIINDWNFQMEGFLPGAGGFVTDSWRPKVTISTNHWYNNARANHETPSPLVFSPDGTLSFFFFDRGNANAPRLVQYGWF